ncbi:MAG: bifunctional (p)ppGpp synthetase/guanosine-3',5'-bis(diphosphate) 3'-pyrophosphohydrolase [Bacteroidales bacterium]|nr:bifunctional (p)ppGpp synthetase/guanosine-3',5'-bis(diphosphate) 3'-pyrophosphohydrolase [Bacteroidales bacterium]
MAIVSNVFDEKDFAVIQQECNLLMDSAKKRCRNEKELAVVKRAFEFANEAHKNVRRRSGAPYILHPIAVARIVVEEIGLGYKSISAALLHDVVEDTDYTVEDIRKQFGEKIAELVDGLTKIKNVFSNQSSLTEADNDEYAKSSQAENFKRILLTLNDDIRVVLIKMADRLHNCRTIEFMPEYKRDKILSETMFIFIPLAHRLGLYSIKSELENIWLRFKEPGAYKEISDRISKNVADKDHDIDRFIEPMQKALEGRFRFVIKKRIKTPYSIWQKMQTKHVTFEQIYDLYAIRIVFEHAPASKDTEREECFHIYSIISSIYTSRQERFRDWVSNSKSNGYEALHCTLMDKTGMNVEVQIRSRRMDDIAEKGIAAHWAYKQQGYVTEGNLDKWLAKVQETLSNPDYNTAAALEELHKELMIGEIVVFTPKGAQKTIPKGSTALDFAYQVHTEIGNKAIAAKINHKPVALSHTLSSGDIVEIITAEDATPQRSYLKFLHSRTARTRVIDWFRQDFASITEEGRQKCIKDFNMIGIDVTKNYLIGRIASRKGFNNADEFLYRYGLGLIPFADVAELPSLILKTNFAAGKKIETREIEIDGSMVDDSNIKIATCCNPIAGDPVVGFRNPNGIITIHKKSCKEAELEASKHGDWIVMPQWKKSIHQSFLVRILISGIDRMGLLNEITRYISLIMGVNIKGLTIGANEGIVDGKVDLYVQDREVLEELIEKLRSINGITSVERSKS